MKDATYVLLTSSHTQALHRYDTFLSHLSQTHNRLKHDLAVLEQKFVAPDLRFGLSRDHLLLAGLSDRKLGWWWTEWVFWTRKGGEVDAMGMRDRIEEMKLALGTIEAAMMGLNIEVEVLEGHHAAAEEIHERADRLNGEMRMEKGT